MTTAILISGQTRTFADCIANQNWFLYRKIKDPVFFVSVADDEQAKDAYLLEGYAKDVFIERVKQPTLPEPDFALAKHAPYTPTPNNKSVVQSILRQLWAYQRVWDFMESRGTKFDTYIRLRPDLFFHKLSISPRWMDDGASVHGTTFQGPWKATCGGVNDRFGIMGHSAAKAYFTAFSQLNTLLDAGCPLHPESIQKAALEAAGCAISNTLVAEFTCLRLPGQGNHVPLLEYPGELAAFIAATR